MVGFVAALVVVMQLPLSISQKMRHGASEAAAPLQRLVGSVTDGVGSATRAVTDRKGIIEENRELRQQVAELQRQVQDLEAVEAENIQLARELKFSSRKRHSQIAAKVIGRDIGGWWRMISLDRGARDGVKVDQAVVTSRGLVGKVADVTDRTCKVMLISDPACKVSARLADKPTSGVMSGSGVSLRGRVRCEMSLINKDIPVERNDRLLTTGMGGIFPGGIEIGYIDEVALDESGLYQRATVIPAVDLGSVGLVFLILDSEGNEQ